MRIYDLIAKKRDGGTHSREELEAIVSGFVSGEVADYQMAAWMMAVYLRGMTDEETAELTDVMAHSGVMVDLSPIPGIKVDKHSTGAMTSVVLSPTPPVECLSTLMPGMGERSTITPLCAITSVSSAVSSLVMPRRYTAIIHAAIW